MKMKPYFLAVVTAVTLFVAASTAGVTHAATVPQATDAGPSPETGYWCPWWRPLCMLTHS